jgi:hypothetical protein
MNDNSPTIGQIIDDLRAVTADAISLIKQDPAVIVATIEGAPERITNVAKRLADGRNMLDRLDELFVAAEDLLCNIAERKRV